MLEWSTDDVGELPLSGTLGLGVTVHGGEILRVCGTFSTLTVVRTETSEGNQAMNN